MPQGTASLTLGFSVNSFGSRIPASGQLNQTIPFTQSATGFLPIKGQATPIADILISATGAVQSGDISVDVTVPFSVSSAANVIVGGSFNQILQFSTDTEVDVTGEVNVNVPLDILLTANGGVLIEATEGETTLPGPTGSSQGFVQVKGTFNQILPITFSGVYNVVSNATIAGTVPDFSLASVAINDSTRVYSRIGQNDVVFRDEGINDVIFSNESNDLYFELGSDNGVRIVDENKIDDRTSVKLLSGIQSNNLTIRQTQRRIKSSSYF